MIRLFVAIALPEVVKDRIAALAGGVPGAKWTDRDNMHLTLRFIGEVPEDRMADIHHGLSRIRQPAFDISLAGSGYFKQGRNPTTLWVGVERNDALQQLRDKVEQALQREGFDADTRRYSPHITLARLQRAPEARIAAFVAEHNLFRTPPIPVSSFGLFSSFLSSSGAIYTEEAEYPLSDYSLAVDQQP
jgi:2'-5' RNA ligase